MRIITKCFLNKIFMRFHYNIKLQNRLFFCCSFLTILYLVYFLSFQELTSVYGGKGWDGRYYYDLVRSNLQLNRLPFGLRIGVPAVVKLIAPQDILHGFKLVNIVFGIFASYVTFILLYFANKRKQGLLTLIVGWFLICGTSLSPIPNSIWYPAQTDAGANFFLLVVLLLNYCKTSSVLSRLYLYLTYFTVFFLGTMIRENFPMFLICLIFQLKFFGSNWLFFIKENFCFFERVLVSLAGVAIAFFLIYHVTGFSPITGKSEFFIKIILGQNLVEVIAAVVNVYGSIALFFIVTLLFPQKKQIGLNKHNNNISYHPYVLACVMGIIIIVSLGGGTNTERFLYWGTPILVISIIGRIQEVVDSGWGGKVVVIVATMLSFVLNRTFVPILASGIGSCEVLTLAFSPSTFVGHWAQVCGPAYALNLIVAYVIVATIFAIVSLILRSFLSDYTMVVDNSENS